MKFSIASALLFASTVFAETYFLETFSDDTWKDRWIQSTYDTDFGKFEVSSGKFYGNAEDARGLRTTEDNRFYAIAAPLPKPYSNKEKPLVIQYTLKYEQGIDCGGGYIKLLPSAENLSDYNGHTDYNIMFGPDICGPTTKTHAILTYKGVNHLINRNLNAIKDEFTHIYTFILKPDQTYVFKLDNVIEGSGKIENDWNIFGAKMIPDTNAKKPADWVDEATIPDPNDKKPADWDSEPATIPDPKAKKPAEWDDETDGKWEPPMIPNPKARGPWAPRSIPNPKYRGPWKQPDVLNPSFSGDPEACKYTTAAIGIDVWQVKSGTIFDDIMITDSVEEASRYAREVILPKMSKEKAKKAKADEELAQKEKEEKEKSAKPSEEGKDPELNKEKFAAEEPKITGLDSDSRDEL